MSWDDATWIVLSLWVAVWVIWAGLCSWAVQHAFRKVDDKLRRMTE